MQEIAKEDEEKQKRRIRRLVSQQERLKTRPPRFGKHKYGSSLPVMNQLFVLQS